MLRSHLPSIRTGTESVVLRTQRERAGREGGIQKQAEAEEANCDEIATGEKCAVWSASDGQQLAHRRRCAVRSVMRPQP
jgi:hypothetical protein